jgi:hypothetical protein
MRGIMRVSRIKQLDHKHLYVLSVMLFLGVIGTYAYALHDITPEASSSTTAAATSSNPPLLGVKMPINSEEAARKVAESQNPDGAILKVQTVHKSNGLTYQVLFTDGSSVEVLAADGTIVNPDKPLDNQPSDQPTAETPAEETPPADETPTEETPEEEPEPTPDGSSTDNSPHSDV